MSVATFPIYKFTPGPCRICGARPHFRGQWVVCTDPLCHMSRHPTTVQCWPRARVVDVPATLLVVGMVCSGGFCLGAAIAAVWFLLGMLTP